MALPYDFVFATRKGEGNWYFATLCGDRYHVRDYCDSFDESEQRVDYSVWLASDLKQNIDCGEWVIIEICYEASELNCNLEDVL